MTKHQAQPLAYPLGRSRFLGQLMLGMWLAGLLLVLLWVYVTWPPGGRTILGFAAVLGVGAAARSGWKNAAAGQLSWDGEVWHWESASYQTGVAQYELSVIADFQHMLLLRLENQANARLWLWAEATALPERWLDLRRAVYSPRKPPAIGQPDDLPHSEPPTDAAAAKGTLRSAELSQPKS